MASFEGFPPDFLKFFNDLSRNNNRAWFQEHKPRYQASVVAPMLAFIEAMQPPLARISPHYRAIAKAHGGSLFRIYRDTRFSKDKTPYKTNMSAVINHGGRKDMLSPGMYVEMGPEHVRVYGGLYMLSSDQLLQVRQHIAANLKEFKKLYSGKKFKAGFQEVRGEQHKRIPKEFAAVVEQEPLILNKQFYYFAQEKPSLIAKDELSKVIMDHYKTHIPLSRFLFDALR